MYMIKICMHTDLRLGQFFSLGADFFEDSRVKIHGSDPHAH